MMPLNIPVVGEEFRFDSYISHEIMYIMYIRKIRIERWIKRGKLKDEWQ